MYDFCISLQNWFDKQNEAGKILLMLHYDLLGWSIIDLTNKLKLQNIINDLQPYT